MANGFDTIKTEHPRAYEAWRPVDEAIIRVMGQASATIEEMANRLGRTETEVADYLQRTGRSAPAQ